MDLRDDAEIAVVTEVMGQNGGFIGDERGRGGPKHCILARR